MEEEEEPAHQRSPKMIDPADDGKQVMPGSAKMEETPEEDEPLGSYSPKMMDQGDGGSPGGPKMVTPEVSPGDPVMNDPGEGPTPGMKNQKKMNKKMRRY